MAIRVAIPNCNAEKLIHPQPHVTDMARLTVKEPREPVDKDEKKQRVRQVLSQYHQHINRDVSLEEIETMFHEVAMRANQNPLQLLYKITDQRMHHVIKDGTDEAMKAFWLMEMKVKYLLGTYAEPSKLQHLHDNIFEPNGESLDTFSVDDAKCLDECLEWIMH